MERLATVLTEKSVITGLSVIEHEGALWIVTGWLEHKTKPLKRPARIIRMTGLDYQQSGPTQGGDFLVNQPIPRAVLDGLTPPEQAAGFVVIDTPKIEIEVTKPH